MEFQRVRHLGTFVYEAIKESLYRPERPDFDSKGAPSQAGRVWLVTGSTSGIGFEVACQLAELGAQVWLTGRSEAKAKEHLELLRARVSGAKAEYLLLDFADLATIKPGLEPLLKSGLPLHGIVHNAGVMLTPSSARTAQGHEMQIGTNNIAPWLLQRLLDPLLLASTQSAGGRIVWVSSLAHYSAPYNGDLIAANPTKFFGRVEGYGQSKAIDAMMAIQWSKMHPEANVLSTSVHPGVIDTNLGRELPGLGAQALARVSWPVEYGAASELAAALYDFPNNAYIVPFGRLGALRPDIRAAAEKDLRLATWLDEQIKEWAGAPAGARA